MASSFLGAMKILRAQVDEFVQRTQESFRELMCAIVRERYPEKTGAMTDEDLRALIDESMKTAHGYGIELEGDVEAYIHILFQRGFDFDRVIPWARDILNREGWSGRIRIDLLRAAHEGRIPGPGGGLFFP